VRGGYFRKRSQSETLRQVRYQEETEARIRAESVVKQDRVTMEPGVVRLPDEFREVARLSNEAGLAGIRFADLQYGVTSVLWVGGRPCFHDYVSQLVLTYHDPPPAPFDPPWSQGPQ
jgi:hypothetical protein